MTEIMKSEPALPVAPDKAAEEAAEAVRNTIDLAGFQKKKLRLKFIAAFMIYIAAKGSFAVLSDSDPRHYNNLPRLAGYTLLAVYLAATGVVIYRAFRKE